ncbi:hypothetical protein [Methanocella conradii]|uniref:hypothetical protein n=1 Tax=Methanocella conradii TaxID=1175444 RepID=UPI00157CDED9|nr:hypothetical protein [Methanocella conradii]
MKINIQLLIFIIFIIFFIFIVYSIINKNIANNNLISNNTSYNTINPMFNNTSEILLLPSNDYVINHINWTSYSNLEVGYVYKAYISDPTDVIPQKFIEVQILTEVKNTDNKTEILKQLDGVAREARAIYGPNSAINIYGTRGGVAYYFSSMLPYDEHIY